jgi:hypothetical protein
MSTVVDLVARSGELKRELVEFAQQPRLDNELQEAFEACLGGLDWVDEEQACNALDYFLFQHRLRDGRTVVESYAATRSDLDEPARDMLLGWRDVVEGLFEVGRREGDALVLVNLVDELTYRVRSNVGTAAFRPMRPRSFLRTRLVPVGDEWLLSGISQVFPARSRDALHRAAAELSMRCPAWVFRNPDKLARAWELQRQDRADFVEFFGTDQIVVPGHELADRLRELAEFRTTQIHDRLAASGTAPTLSPAATMDLSDELQDAETVGLIYDEIEGLGFFAEFGIVQAAFTDPILLRRRLHRGLVQSYLKDDSVSPLVFRRLAAADPDRASQVFQRLLKRPRFGWDRDGEPLLRRYKPAHFDTPPLPQAVPISDRLTAQFAPPRRARGERLHGTEGLQTRPRSGSPADRRPQRRQHTLER